MASLTQLLKARGLSRWAEWSTPDHPALPDLVQRSCSEWLQKRCDSLGAIIDLESLRVEGYEQHRGKSGQLRAWGVPHGRGDEPTYTGTYMDAVQCSPRAWG